MKNNLNSQAMRSKLYPCCFSSNYCVMQFHPEEFLGNDKKQHNNALLAVYKSLHSPDHAHTHRHTTLKFDHLHL